MNWIFNRNLKVGLFFSTVLFTCFTLFPACTDESPKSESNGDENSEEASNLPVFTPRGEDNARIAWQKPQKVIAMLGDLSKDTLVEIGAGTGYFTFRLLPNTAKLIATDIDSQICSYLENIRDEHLPDSLAVKLEVRQVREDEHGLERQEVDLIFISNTYAYINDRVSYLRALKSALKADAEIVIVDFKMRRIPVGPETEFKLPLYQVENELLEAGYEIVRVSDHTLPYQYVIIAKQFNAQ